MNWMKRTALAIAAGAALSFSAAAPSSAAPAGASAASATGAALAQTDSNLIEVRRRYGGHRYYGGFRGHRYGGYGYRRYGYYGGGRRWGRRHHGFPWWLAAPLIAAPFAYHSYDYDPYY